MFKKGTMIKKNADPLRAWLFKNFFAVSAVVVAVANLWILTKLNPILQDVRVLQTKVEAMSDNQDKTDLALIRIEDKLDSIVMSLNEYGR